MVLQLARVWRYEPYLPPQLPQGSSIFQLTCDQLPDRHNSPTSVPAVISHTQLSPTWHFLDIVNLWKPIPMHPGVCKEKISQADFDNRQVPVACRMPHVKSVDHTCQRQSPSTFGPLGTSVALWGPSHFSTST